MSGLPISHNPFRFSLCIAGETSHHLSLCFLWLKFHLCVSKCTHVYAEAWGQPWALFDAHPFPLLIVVCTCIVHMCVCIFCAWMLIAHMQSSEDSCHFIFSYHVGSRHQVQVVRFCGKCFYQSIALAIFLWGSLSLPGVGQDGQVGQRTSGLLLFLLPQSWD